MVLTEAAWMSGSVVRHMPPAQVGRSSLIHLHDLPFLQQFQPRGCISSPVLLPEDVDAKWHSEVILPCLHGVSDELQLLHVQTELL